MTARVRFATLQDAEMIAEISRQTFTETFAHFNSPENMEKFFSGQFNRELLMREVSEPGNIFLIAEAGDEVAGYARVRENNHPPELPTQGKPSIEISRIYALNKFIGRGIGRTLMIHCLEYAKHKNAGVVWLGVWEHNKRAIDFYKKWGFEKFGTHVFMLGDDAQTDWMMKKEID